MRLLHLSDLHVSVRDDFDRRTVLDPLLLRVEKDRQAGLKPDAVVITGDLASSGAAAEYVAVEPFLEDLTKAAGVPSARLFIVPGNHDVDRSLYRPSDIPAYRSMRDLNAELENPRYRSDLLKGLGAYFEFIATRYPHLAPLHDRLVPFATRIMADDGQALGLVGLNSAWMCRRSPDEKTIAIGEYQLRAAADALQEQGPCDLVVYACHHPPEWLMPEDRKILKSHLDGDLLLCGHLHEAEGGYYQEHAARFWVLQAGAAYLGSDSNLPCRYQHLCIDLEDRRLTVDFRSFHAERRLWTVDAGSGEDGRFVAEFRRPGPDQDSRAGHDSPGEIPAAYREWIAGACGSMEADKLYGKGRAFPLLLPEIFIPLYGDDPEAGKGSRPGREHGALAEKQAPVDLETLVGRYATLLVEGQAGSGKTTLLKHLAFTLSGPDEAAPEEIADHLPVVIFLKDLETCFQDQAEGREALARYLERKLDGLLSLEDLAPWLAAGRVLFLVDGLDEIAPGRRDAVVETLANLMLRGPGNRIVLAGRPHGLEGAALRRYGSRRVRIHNLNQEQIRLFVEKWFDYLYPGPYGPGRKNAEALIAGIRAHPATAELTDNPLMLTAVCILYHDNKELPDQRADLYRKFIDNLLYRRFAEDPWRVRDFLAALALRMQAERVRAVDRVTVLEVMREFHPLLEGESESAYRRRLETVFDELEPRCGLLRPDKGQFAFWHLTFQEFLAADHLRDNAHNHIAAVEPFWTDEWYRETMELYVGSLSLQNKQQANDVVLAGVAAGDEPPFLRWRLAGRSLVDIPEDRRLHPSLEAVRQRMSEIFATGAEPAVLADAGEILGRLGDPRDLKQFIDIPGGGYPSEQGKQREIKPFAIGKYPVVNAWFAEFMAAGGYERKRYWTPEGREWLEHTGATHPRYWHDRRWNCPDAPVVGVCWYEADAFCRWLTTSRNDGWICLLPSEAQWYAAAAGKEGRGYPWGHEWIDGACNSAEADLGKTTSTGIFAKGTTPEGVADLVGNVWEWTRTDYHKNKDQEDFQPDSDFEKKRPLPVLRGGSWLRSRAIARCAVRLGSGPDVRIDSVGFRCARTRE